MAILELKIESADEYEFWDRTATRAINNQKVTQIGSAILDALVDYEARKRREDRKGDNLFKGEEEC